MMEDRLQLGMQNNGFQRGDTNVEGIYLFYCLGEQELTIVSVVHAATGTEFEVEQYEHILQQIKESFHSTHLQKIQLLSLLLTGNPDQAKKLVLNAGQDSRWMIDLRTNRLIIYETQSVNFGWLRQMIDQLLTEEEKQKVPYQTEALKVNDNYNADNNAANNENPNRGYHKDSLNGMSTRRSAYRFALAPVTAVIVALNVIAYIISHYLPILGGTENMMDKGALSWYFIKGSHEYYRFLTSMFLHLDWNHLAGNMIIFIFVGSHLEQVVGKFKYIIIYFGTGILAGIASVSYNMWKEHAETVFTNTTISIGASGAIFGVVGAVLIIVILNKGWLHGISIQQMVIFIILGLYNGVVNYNIDQSAHVGGFIAGVILALLLYRRPAKENPLR